MEFCQRFLGVDEPPHSIDFDNEYAYEATIPGVIEQVKFCIQELKEIDEFKSLDHAQLADIAIKIVNTARQSTGMEFHYEDRFSLTNKLIERLDRLNTLIDQLSDPKDFRRFRP